MQYRTLGRTGIRVSEIGLGAWELGGAYFLRDRSSSNEDPAGYDDVTASAAIDMLGWGLDHGLTFIDTAPIYGDGESERRVAAVLAQRSEAVTVETKLGVFAEDGRYRRLFTREVVRRECERSRQRLGRETIDIELLHSPSRAEFGAGEAHQLRAPRRLRHRAGGARPGITSWLRCGSSSSTESWVRCR